MSYDIDITKTPPGHEPERQYYYMAKAKDFVEKKSKEIGRPMTYFVKTFGCQMNARDSEKLVGILEQIGYVEGTDEHSDFIVYNTCTVRENANNKVYGRLGYLQNYKKKNPLMKIALCGCMMQEPEVVENIKKHYKFVDIVFGTHNIFKFAEILCNNIESGSQVIDIWKDTNQIVEDLPVKRKFSFKSGVNIMFGCNNFCSYCIVPYVRGRERSREPTDIIREIEKLVYLKGQNPDSDAFVRVTVDGKVYGTYPLSKDDTIEIKNVDGDVTNTLVIKDGVADVTSADCPDHLCVKQKAISKEGESIICLPNKVVVMVKSNTKSDIDSISK